MTAEDARIEALVQREAFLLRLAYVKVEEACRTVGIISGDSSKDAMIPAELKAAMMRWASGIHITLSRRAGSQDPPPPGPRLHPSGAGSSAAPAEDGGRPSDVFTCPKCRRLHEWHYPQGKKRWENATCQECWRREKR